MKLIILLLCILGFLIASIVITCKRKIDVELLTVIMVGIIQSVVYNSYYFISNENAELWQIIVVNILLLGNLACLGIYVYRYFKDKLKEKRN